MSTFLCNISVTIYLLLSSGSSCSRVRHCSFLSLMLKFVANQLLQVDVVVLVRLNNGMTTILSHPFCHVPCNF